MDTLLFSFFITLSAMFGQGVLSQSCEKTYYKQCLDQLVDFTDRGNLQFATSREDLRKECVQARFALSCLQKFSKNCHEQKEHTKFKEMIDGPSKLTLGLCTEDGDLRAKYLESLPCLKNASEGLEFCKQKHERNQNDIMHFEYHDKMRLECCSFDGYRRCLRMRMEIQDGCPDDIADVVDEIVTRMAGVLAEEMCADYADQCIGSGCAARTGSALSLAFAFLLALASSVLIVKHL